MKANQPNFANLDIGSMDRNSYPEISDNVQQTLSRILGYDIGNGIYRRILADSDGRMLVSSSATQGATAVNSAVVIGVASSQVVAANGSRKSVTIQNLGTVPIYLTYGDTAVIATGLQIPVNGVYIEDRYLGRIVAISTLAAQDVRVLEV